MQDVIEPPAVEPPQETPALAPARRRAWPRTLASAALAMFLFVLALELLKRGARPLAPVLTDVLGIRNAVNTLGFGWLVAYAVLSGSPVAAIALSFFDQRVIDGTQTFTMITGSRLGASFIVLFVGFLYHLRGHRRGVSIAIGVLCLLVTATIYLPAMGIGMWLLQNGWLARLAPARATQLTSLIDLVYDPILTRLDLLFGRVPWLFFFVGVGLLLGAFNLLDRALPTMHAERSAFQGIGRLVYRPWAMFLLGMAVTSVTLSVSVSLSILVPLSARGLVRRENAVPYIMGANITTFIDTLFAALVMSGEQAFTIVLVEMLSVAAISVLVLLAGYRLYERSVLVLLDGIMHTNRTLALFMALMLIVPVLLMLWR